MPTTLLDLSTEILSMILFLLRPVEKGYCPSWQGSCKARLCTRQQVVRLRLVCPEFRAIIDQRAFWNELDESSRSYSNYTPICSRFATADLLAFAWVHRFLSPLTPWAKGQLLCELCLAVEDAEVGGRDQALTRGLKLIGLLELEPWMMSMEFVFSDKDNMRGWVLTGARTMGGLHALFPGRIREWVNLVRIICTHARPCLICPLTLRERSNLEHDIVLHLLK
jgi:hypothetical protein